MTETTGIRTAETGNSAPVASRQAKFLPSWLADCLDNTQINVRRPVEGPLMGLHRSPHQGASVEFSEYREYMKGDPISRIDWAVYARSDRYVIRQTIEETNLRAWILLDTSKSMDYKLDGDYTKLDYARYLAAGTMYSLLKQGDLAGLLVFDSEIRKQFEPAGSFEGLRRILLGLEDIEPGQETDLSSVLHDAADRITSKSLIILISDLLQDPESIVSGIEHLHHNGHDVRVYHILDPAELHLPPGGPTELRELENGRMIEVNLDEIRDSYQLEIQKYLEELYRGCTNAMASYKLLNTTTPLDDALREVRSGR